MKIIITAPVHPHLLESFETKGFEVVYEKGISYSELSNFIHDADGLVITTRLQIDKPLIDKAAKLKWIGRLGSGLELIDIDYAVSKNIACVSTPEGNRTAVGEHTLGLLLSLTHKIQVSANEVKNGLWLRNENRGTEITGKTIGIVGYGNTGSAFAKTLSGFDATILAFDKYKFDFGNRQVREASLEQLAEYADVISFHVPLTAETTKMANEEFFRSLKRKPVLLNTSRGKVIDFFALETALEQGMISGCGLDVLENENIDQLNEMQQHHFNFLQAQPNVIITPHIAGYSHEAYYKMSAFLLEKLELLQLI